VDEARRPTWGFTGPRGSRRPPPAAQYSGMPCGQLTSADLRQGPQLPSGSVNRAGRSSCRSGTLSETGLGRRSGIHPGVSGSCLRSLRSGVSTTLISSSLKRHRVDRRPSRRARSLGSSSFPGADDPSVPLRASCSQAGFTSSLQHRSLILSLGPAASPRRDVPIPRNRLSWRWPQSGGYQVAIQDLSRPLSPWARPRLAYSLWKYRSAVAGDQRGLRRRACFEGVRPERLPNILGGSFALKPLILLPPRARSKGNEQTWLVASCLWIGILDIFAAAASPRPDTCSWRLVSAGQGLSSRPAAARHGRCPH
jgi:hypothetical protein